MCPSSLVTIRLDAQFGTPYPRSAGFDTDTLRPEKHVAVTFLRKPPLRIPDTTHSPWSSPSQPHSSPLRAGALPLGSPRAGAPLLGSPARRRSCLGPHLHRVASLSLFPCSFPMVNHGKEKSRFLFSICSPRCCLPPRTIPSRSAATPSLEQPLPPNPKPPAGATPQHAPSPSSWGPDCGRGGACPCRPAAPAPTGSSTSPAAPAALPSSGPPSSLPSPPVACSILLSSFFLCPDDFY